MIDSVCVCVCVRAVSSGNGLAVVYQFSRRAHHTSSKMVALDLTFQNCSSATLSGIRVDMPQSQSGVKMSTGNANIKSLTVNTSHPMSIGIDFKDTLQPAKFEIW